MDGKELRRVIEQHFHLGYENQVILAFFNSRHGITMSLATLKQRLRDYGLSRHYVEVDDQRLKEVVQRKISTEFIKSILPEISMHRCHGSIFRATVCSQKPGATTVFLYTQAGTSSLFFDLATS